MTKTKSSIKFATRVSNFINKKISDIDLLKKYVLEKIIELKEHVANVKAGLRDLRSTNILLAFYHLRQGNVNDAILRFKIIDIFISPNDEEVHYGFAWCYFLKGNYVKSMMHLKQSGARDISGLGYFLTNWESLAEVPELLWSEYRSITADSYNYQWIKHPVYLPKEFANCLFGKIEELPKECRILDLGCGSGLAGAAIDYRIQKKYHLTGVDNIASLTKNIKNLREDKRKVYDEVISLSLRDFTSSNSSKYDIITSFESLNFAKNLTPYLAKINKMLKANGYFALMLKTNNTTAWDIDDRCFIYTKDYVKEQLIVAEFKILDIKEVYFAKNSIYNIFIVTK